MLALAVPVGVLIGLVMGALGGGGAVLSVPILVFGFGLAPHDATTASLLIVGVGAVAGVLAHHRAGTVRWRSGLLLGVLGSPAASAGSWIARSIDPDLLLMLFTGLLLVVSAHMLRSTRGPEPVADADRGSTPKIVLTALATGLLTGFFGVGGGFVLVPALVAVLGYRMPVAVGTSLLVMVLNSSAALLSRAVEGLHLDWPLLLTFTAAAVVGNLFGGLVTARVRSVTLQRAFAVLLIVVALYTAVRSVLGLAG